MFLMKVRLPIISLAIILLISSLTTAFTRSLDEDRISKVNRGELKEAYASWWGFDPEDSTEILQAAIDSGVERLIIDKMPSAWITRPLKLRSNLTIVFEDGVELVAKRGEFKGGGDSLLTIDDCDNVTLIGYGATLRMWKEDYANPKLYSKAEWRMAIAIHSSRNINIYGLKIRESGGDGIYLGTLKGKGPNKNIHIKDVVCDGNYRQGISVISAENLLIENSILENTSGTAPQAGIDFEPNRPDEVLINCLMKNCIVRNNKGAGLQLYLANLNNSSKNISIRFENCKVIGNTNSVFLYLTNDTERAPDGIIEFENCTFQDSIFPALYISKPADKVICRFINCSIINPAQKRNDIAPIVLYSKNNAKSHIGGIQFLNCYLHDSIKRSPVKFARTTNIGLKDIFGTIKIKEENTDKVYEITEELLNLWIAKQTLRDVPYLPFDLSSTEALAQIYKAANTANIKMKSNMNIACAVLGSTKYIVYAKEKDTIIIRIRKENFKKDNKILPTIIIEAKNGTILKTPQNTHVDKNGTLSLQFTAEVEGAYRITISPVCGRLELIESSHPVAIELPADFTLPANSERIHYFFVPAKADKFAARILSHTDPIKAELLYPTGGIREGIDNFTGLYQFDVNLLPSQEGKVWAIKVINPNRRSIIYTLNLLGIPPLSTEKASLLQMTELTYKNLQN